MIRSQEVYYLKHRLWIVFNINTGEPLLSCGKLVARSYERAREIAHQETLALIHLGGEFDIRPQTREEFWS